MFLRYRNKASAHRSFFIRGTAAQDSARGITEHSVLVGVHFLRDLNAFFE
jgi:hypothetical protein